MNPRSARPMSPSVKTELPGPRAKEFIARGAFDMQSIYRQIVADEEHSSGCWLADVDGNVMLDLFANFALGALGYNHPALLEVARSPAFQHVSVNPTSTPFLTMPSWFEFLEALQSRYAPRGMAKAFFVDGGGEGVEAALKAAFIVHGERRRVASGRPANPLQLPEADQQQILNNIGTDSVLVSFSGAFHGRGIGPMSASHSKVMHKADLPAFCWPMAPYPANRFPLSRFADENARAEAAALTELERILDACSGKAAAVIVEPIQGEGGDRHASAPFYRGVQALANAAGAAFILDEVQTGVAISGTMWCHEQFELPRPPDLMAFGKKMQMGGFFATEPYDIRTFGRMYQTRNGDRARAMLAHAILRTIDGQDLLANVRKTGAHFLAGLEELAEKYPQLLTEPRGRGFLLAFDFPNPAVRDDFLKRSLRKGVFATYTGSRSVRLRPHLITTSAEADVALAVFDAVLREMSA
jgi:4-aminobutyrate aminotransferase / (S)-3-amino-2-methylpropionate transaminase